MKFSVEQINRASKKPVDRHIRCGSVDVKSSGDQVAKQSPDIALRRLADDRLRHFYSLR